MKRLRAGKYYTVKEASEISEVSIRIIQMRIKNGEVVATPSQACIHERDVAEIAPKRS